MRFRVEAGEVFPEEVERAAGPVSAWPDGKGRQGQGLSLKKSGGHFRDVSWSKTQGRRLAESPLCPTHWKGAHIMYLHLGQDTIVNERDIVGVFDLDNSTVSRHTRDFLSKAQKEGRGGQRLYGAAKVLCGVPAGRPHHGVYLSNLHRHLAAAGLLPGGRLVTNPLHYWERLVLLCSILEFPNAPIAKNG